MAAEVKGSPIQKYYSDKKIEKSAGSFCGQKYSIDKSITNRLLAGFSALIFRNQNPAYTIKKRKGETLIYWRNSKFGQNGFIYWPSSTLFDRHGSFCTAVSPLYGQRRGRYACTACCVMLLPLLLTLQVGSASPSVASPAERDDLSFSRL